MGKTYQWRSVQTNFRVEPGAYIEKTIDLHYTGDRIMLWGSWSSSGGNGTEWLTPNGGTINVMIVDDNNYLLWLNGEKFDALYNVQWSWHDYNIIVLIDRPTGVLYHLVFSNIGSSYQKRLQAGFNLFWYNVPTL